MKNYSKTIRQACLALFLLFTAGIQAQLKVQDIKELPAHPRILLYDEDIPQIKSNIAGDSIWKKLHQSILNESDKILQLSELQRIKTGKRLLSVSREAIRRIFYLSYSYRMSGEAKYLQKAEKELLAVSEFEDWNPSHFLDVAEMSVATAIGYDWLYHSLSVSTREKIKNALISKAIDASFNDRNAWHKKAKHNWNQVCNAGITYGLLAIWEDIPELSKTMLQEIVESLRLPMDDYAPDGAYPEGYGYWEYGTSFNVLFLSAIEKITGSDFGLTNSSAFLKTALYQENMTGPSGKCFNYSDGGEYGALSSTMFWFASKLKDPSLLWNEKAYLAKDINIHDRLLPTLMIWGGNVQFKDIQAPQKLLWTGQGVAPVALMRTSWTDSQALFVGFKGGTASSNHAHIDAGSFILEADGVRWASDFGAQDYNSLETKGVDLWNVAQNSQRWQVFRYNNFAHNTLTVDGQLHNVKGYADIRSASDSPDFINATTDLSNVLEGQLAECVRGVAIINKQYAVVRDEVKTTGKETTIRWTMMTTADVKLKGNKAIELRKNGKKLNLEVVEPAKITLKTWTTVPTHDYDALNPGTILVGFEVKVPADTKTALTVKLIPQSAKKSSEKIPELAQWPNSK
jgi:hypothetical protein